MGLEIEYQMVAGFVVLYLIILTIFSFLGQAQAELSFPSEEVSLVKGLGFFTNNVYAESSTPAKLIYSIFIGSPLLVISAMLIYNGVRGRG